MTVVHWAVAASELLRTDVKGIVNRMVKAPGSLAVGAFLPFSVALVLLFPFALLVNNAWGDSRPLIAAYAMPIAILWAFGPPRWAPAASVLVPSLPVGQRAVYVHSIARIVLTFSLGFLYAMLPLFLILFPFQPDAAVELVMGMWPPAALIAVSLAMGTALWGIIGRAKPVVHWGIRAALVMWFGGVALVGAGGATIEEQLNLLGPLRPFAEIAAPPDVFEIFPPFADPTDTRAQSAALLLAFCLPAMLLPIQRFAPRATAEATFLRRGAEGSSEVRQRFARPDFGLRRVFRPFPIPLGRTEALSYLSRQWLKVFMWVVIIYGILVTVSTVSALLPPGVDPIGPRPPPGRIDPAMILAGLYTAALAGLALVRSPEAFEWAAGLRGRKSKAFKIPVPAFLRIGPPALSLKRWPQLQTFPYSQRDLNSAFLIPLGLFLVVTLVLTISLVGAANDFQENWFEPALFAAACGLIIVGGFFVGARSSKRFARRFDPALETVHTVSAALWAAGVIPLILVGTVWFVTRGVAGGGVLEGREVALFVFVLAAVVMPGFAYGTAVNRTVAVERRYEPPGMALGLFCGAFLFFVVPVTLLFLWWLPDV